MRSTAGLLLVTLLLVTPVAASAAAPDAPQPGGVTISVQLRPDGDARITVQSAYALNSSAERAAFERLRAEFERGEVGFQPGWFEDAAAEAANRTGRDMAVRNVTRSSDVVNRSAVLAAANATNATNATTAGTTTLTTTEAAPGVAATGGAARTTTARADPSPVGVLTLEFTWTNFARSTGERAVLGDVFETPWLRHLSEDHRLVVEAPPNYGVTNVEAPGTGYRLVNSTLTWTGPVTFEEGEPSVRFVKGVNPTTNPPPPPTTPGPGLPVNEETLQTGLAVAGALLIGAVLTYLWTHRDGGEDATTDAMADAPPDDAGARAAESEPEPEPADVEPPVSNGTAAASEEDVDPGLLSDEERVLRLLRGNGGRMKQANIVKETGWSNAKVSQLLSAMDDDDQVDKLRIGRENLITLSGENVAEFDE